MNNFTNKNDNLHNILKKWWWIISPTTMTTEITYGEEWWWIISLTSMTTKTTWWTVVMGWVSDCCLTPIQQLFSYIMARACYFSMRWSWGPLCTRPTRRVGLYYCWLTETTVRGQTCRSTRTYYSASKPTSLCSFSLMLRSYRRSNKYQINSVWFDPTGARTHDLPHSKRAG